MQISPEKALPGNYNIYSFSGTTVGAILGQEAFPTPFRSDLTKTPAYTKDTAPEALLGLQGAQHRKAGESDPQGSFPREKKSCRGEQKEAGTHKHVFPNKNKVLTIV